MDTNKFQQVKKVAGSISWSDVVSAKDFRIDNLWKLTASIFFKDKKVSETQYKEMKKAYFAGFTEAFRVLTDYAGDLPEDKACELFSRIAKECGEFADEQIKQNLGMN